MTNIIISNQSEKHSNVSDVELLCIQYNISKHVDSFSLILSHWYNVVKGSDDDICKDWRQHLSSSKRKRFQRMSRVIGTFQKVLRDGAPINKAKA